MGCTAGQGTSFHTPRLQKESFFVVEYNLDVLRDADLMNLLEIWFLHYSCDVKCFFMQPCIPGVILGQNCIRLLDAVLYDLIFSTIYFIKNSVNML